MKPRSIGSLSVLVLLAGCGSGSSSGGGGAISYTVPRWFNQQRVPTASHLRAVSFNTPLQGFVAGFDSSIYRTDDGGVSWVQSEHLPATRGGDVRAVDFLGFEVHAVGVDEAGTAGRYWTSTDALNFTTPDAAGAGSPFVAADVTQAITGGQPYVSYYLREDWRVRVASNGTSAESVTLLAAVPAPVGQAASIDIIYDGPGFAVGSGGQFYETTDFANTWTPVTGTAANLRKVHAQGPGAVFACGDGGALVFKDAGTAVAPIAGGPATNWKGVYFIHNQVAGTSVGWVVGEGGVIRKVTGTYAAPNWTWTWLTQTSNTSENLYDVTFLNDQVGYAVGDNGMVVKTTDGGATPWTVVTGGRLDAVNAVSFDAGGTVGVAVGDNGYVYKTLNGGAFWSSVNLGAMKWTGVCIPPGNPNTAFICGEGGQIRRNLDLAGGNTWTSPFAAPPNIDYRAILFFSSADVGLVAGNGQLLYTNNGTQGTWDWDPTLGTPAIDYRCLSTSFGGGGLDIFAAGATGVIVTNTVNGYAGLWTTAAAAGSFGNQTIVGIQSPNPNILFAAVDFNGSRLQRRLGAGPFVWESASQPSPQPPIAAGLAFPSQSFGWWVSDRIYTTEMAANPLTPDWQLSPMHTSAALRGVWMSPSGLVGYAVGENGTILKTISGGK